MIRWFTAWRASRRKQAQERQARMRILARFVAFPRLDPEPGPGCVSAWSVRYWLRRIEREGGRT